MAKNKVAKTNWIATIFLMLGTVAVVFPLYLTIVIALKTPQEMAQSIWALPKKLHFENFTEAIRMTKFFTAFGRSFFITASAVVLTLITNSFVAYAIARNSHKKFYKCLYYYFISAMFVPFAVIMLPVVKETSMLNLDNQYGLILLYTVYGLAFNVFLYTAYIKSLPISLEEAAMIEGATRWQIFWKVVFPLLKPINATVIILTSLWVWNDFMLPLVLLGGKEELATLPLKQYVFQSQFSTNYNLGFASYLLALAPLVIVYLVAQKQFLSGVTNGSLK